MVGHFIMIVLMSIAMSLLVATFVSDLRDSETKEKIRFRWKLLFWVFSTVLLLFIVYLSIEYGKGIIPPANKKSALSHGRLELNNIYEVACEVDTGEEIIAVIKSQNDEFYAYKFPEKLPKIFKVTDDTDDKYTWEKFPKE